MLIPVSMLFLASQLVIAVADDVPQFDIRRGCKIDSAAVSDPNAGMSGTIKRCMDDEQQALLARYVDAFERYDMDSLTDLLRKDATWNMPPFEGYWLQPVHQIATSRHKSVRSKVY